MARELAQTMRDALSAMEAMRVRSTPVVEGRIVLGTIRTVQTSILPAALLEVHRRYPKLFVRAIQGDSGGLMQHLKTGILDAAVVVRPTGGGASRFRWVPLAHEPFVLIAPPRSTGNSVSELLRTHDWIQFDSTLVSGKMAAQFSASRRAAKAGQRRGRFDRHGACAGFRRPRHLGRAEAKARHQQGHAGARDRARRRVGSPAARSRS
jgi:DNA-binding transcriptional LysR family regulator